MLADKFRLFVYEKNRVEAFSDGVLAIVITLLVLEIKVPRTGEMHTMREVFDALYAQRGEFAGWLISFLMVGLAWVQHHNLLHMTRKFDLAMLWINLLFLGSVCLIPFTSGLVGENPYNPAVMTIFGLELTVSTLLMCWLYRYVARHYLKPTYDPVKVRRNVKLSFVLAPLTYLIATFSAWIHIGIAYALFVLIPIVFIFPLDVEKTSDRAVPADYPDIE